MGGGKECLTSVISSFSYYYPTISTILIFLRNAAKRTDAAVTTDSSMQYTV